MKTSSNQTIESSSSNRPLSGDKNTVLVPGERRRRDTTRRPRAFTGTMNHRCLGRRPPATRSGSGHQQVLREGRAGVHLDLAADHDAVGGLADQA